MKVFLRRAAIRKFHFHFTVAVRRRHTLMSSHDGPPKTIADRERALKVDHVERANINQSTKRGGATAKAHVCKLRVSEEIL